MADDHPQKTPSAPPPEEEVSVPLDPEKPPSYQNSGEGGSPPSYTSLYGQVKEAKAGSDGVFSFLSALFTLLLNTLCMTIFLALLLSLPIAMIVIGVIYKDDCPAQNLIPIYLITMGTVYLVKSLIDLKVRTQKSRLPPEERKDFEPGVEDKVSRFLALFIFVFFICGNVWIYGIYAPNTMPPPPTTSAPVGPSMNTTAAPVPYIYCNHVLYYFAFWVTTACYIFVLAACCCCCTVACVAGLTS